MARLGEVPVVLRRVGPVAFLRRVYREVNDDNVMTMAAAVAFYWLMAVFPFVLFLLAIPSLLPFGVKTDMRELVTSWAQESLTPGTAKVITDNVEAAVETPKGGFLILGLALTLWAASNGMNATMAALDRCYDIRKPRPFFAQRGVALLLTIGACLIFVALAVLLPGAGKAIELLTTRFPDYAPKWMSGPLLPVIDVGRRLLGVTLVTFMVSAVYQFGVSVRRRWTIMTPGAVFTVATVIVLASGFNLYIQKFGQASYAKTYGAVGGVIILLLLFYFYAVVFLIGAEINSEIDYEVLGPPPESQDGLPKLYGKEDLEKFRRQLEKRESEKHPRRE